MIETLTMNTVYCADCGMPFGMTNSFHGRCLTFGRTFYCPAGHSQYFTKSVKDTLEQKLREERAAKEAALRQASEALRNERIVKSKLKKINKRILNGVCPKCNRYFPKLNSHMKTKHLHK